MKKLNWVVVLFLAVLFIACKKDKQEDEPVECADQISYASDIATIMSTSCNTAGCHNAAGASGGLVFENHSQVSDHASKILNAIRHEGGFQPMPQGSAKLSDEIINKVACWIEQGKPNN